MKKQKNGRTKASNGRKRKNVCYDWEEKKKARKSLTSLSTHSLTHSTCVPINQTSVVSALLCRRSSSCRCRPVRRIGEAKKNIFFILFSSHFFVFTDSSSSTFTTTGKIVCRVENEFFTSSSSTLSQSIDMFFMGKMRTRSKSSSTSLVNSPNVFAQIGRLLANSFHLIVVRLINSLERLAKHPTADHDYNFFVCDSGWFEWNDEKKMK